MNHLIGLEGIVMHHSSITLKMVNTLEKLGYSLHCAGDSEYVQIIWEGD